MSDTIVTVIKPKVGWQLIDWKELRDYRDLFFFFVWRDVQIQYKQTVLGFLWAFIQPVFNMLVMTLVFGYLANIPSDNVQYAIFNLVALVPWLYFQNSVTMASQSLVTNANMITKVYFPRVVVPMAPILAKLIDFGIGLGIVGLGLVYFQIAPTTSLFALPLLIVLLMLTAAGIGMWMTSLSVQYRDVKHMMSFVVELMKFGAPVVWSVTLITERYGPGSPLQLWGMEISGETLKLIYGLYPVGGIIDGFRSALLGKPLDWPFIATSGTVAVLIFLSGLMYFKRTEKVFADVA